jgi:substrate import-associated zinc metallohydrolase lipoprotein
MRFMKYKNIIAIMIILALTGAACNDPYNENDTSDPDYVTNDETREPTELDNWLTNNFTTPYNIQVKYRWDNSELDPYKNLTPPAVTKVQGVMDVVKKVWIETYNQVAATNFIKEYCPKQFVLVGSANYNYDGSTTIGTAEGGRKVVLFVVNDFDPHNNAGVKQLIHTVQHEFGHILNQNISYQPEFKEVTAGNYTANWSSVSLSEARARGFITSYAMASTDEDFVEMIATMLVEGKDGYERILACETNASSRQLLKKKEQYVVEYFRAKYNIDFYALQTKVQEAINAIAPGEPVEERTPLFDILGYGKDSTAIRFDFNFYSYPSGFATAFFTDFNLLATKGYGLDTYFRLYYSDETHVHLQLHYHTNGPGERIYYVANFILEVFQTEDGHYGFWYVDNDENGRMLAEDYGVYNILDFFAGYTYDIDWERSSCPTSSFVGFYPVSNPNEGYTYGILGN